jgi:ppGpp synthetase/RelA/SpoT-type nucleotidyltranferase
VDGKPVEIQLRTIKQDFWASVSELMADQLGIELKYGGTPAGAELGQRVLDWSSAAIAAIEESETKEPRSRGAAFYLGQAAAIMQLGPKLDELK